MFGRGSEGRSRARVKRLWRRPLGTRFPRLHSRKERPPGSTGRLSRRHSSAAGPRRIRRAASAPRSRGRRGKLLVKVAAARIAGSDENAAAGIRRRSRLSDESLPRLTSHKIQRSSVAVTGEAVVVEDLLDPGEGDGVDVSIGAKTAARGSGGGARSAAPASTGRDG
jgi:hypothetical protein